MNTIRCLLVSSFMLALLLAGPDPVAAQTPRILESPNATTNSQFGASVESVGDVNGDGASDVVVSAPGEDVGEESGAGRVYVLSGADGSQLQALTAPSPESLGSFGKSVAVTRLNGTPYVIVGSDGPFLGDNERAYLFDLSDGSAVQTLTPSSAEVIAPAGDLNDDGTPDVLIGGPADTVDGAEEAGRAFVYSGADGSVLLTLNSPNAHAEGEFGAAVAGGSDVNDDGTPDLVVGAPGEDRDDDGTNGEGRAYLIDGADGSVLHTLASQYDGDFGVGSFGTAVAPLSDINGDGTPDLIVGASTEDVFQEDPVHIYGVAGRVHLVSGADGAILRTLASPPSTALGRAVAEVGDVNLDGTSDVIAGAPGTPFSTNQGGPVYVFSGADGAELDSLASQSPEESTAFGIEIAGAGDTDGDGTPDIIVGDGNEDTDAGDSAGRAYLYSGSDISLVARFSQSVSSSGTVDFDTTGVDINFSGTSGSGEVTVERFDTGPGVSEGISEENVSDYRIVIEAGGDLSFGSGTEVRFNVSTFDGVEDPSDVTIYKRDTTGAGDFASLSTSYDAGAGELVATTGSFSEFVFASDTNPLPTEGPAGTPQQFTLEGNAPNPVRQRTTIRYALPQAEKVTLAVYDMLGRQVATLVDRKQAAGRKRVRFEADELSAGVYVYRLRAGDFSETRRMVVVE